jgi:hypothetical protein
MSDGQNSRNRRAGKKDSRRQVFPVEGGKRISQSELIRSVREGIRHFENSPRRRGPSVEKEAGGGESHFSPFRAGGPEKRSKESRAGVGVHRPGNCNDAEASQHLRSHPAKANDAAPGGAKMRALSCAVGCSASGDTVGTASATAGRDPRNFRTTENETPTLKTHE